MLDERQRKILSDLQFVTRNCRPDMHEPDEQGISAIVTGFDLDNACGADPYSNCGEFTVAITTNDGGKTWFNLADLIALARQAQ
jgi:hypothetical protein